MRKIFCSYWSIHRQGANDFDPELIPIYGRQIRCDGFEFMVVSGWERKPSEIAKPRRLRYGFPHSALG